MAAGIHLPPRQKTSARVGARRFVIDAIIWIVLCALLVAGFVNSGKIGGSAFSLRYDTQISGATAYKARQYSIEHSSEDTFWPTFWREDELFFESEYATVSADSIVLSGDASLVWDFVYLSGAAPSVLEEQGFAVSTALAWRLWGSVDVVGKTADVDGETRVVRGVFESERVLALVSYRDVDTSQSWSAVELIGGKRWATRDDAASFATSSGLGSPAAILLGGGISFIASALSVLPLIILGIYALALIFGFVRKQSTLVRNLVPFLALLAFALALPSLLGLLPSWLIPSRWSDFSAWSSLFDKAGAHLSEYLSATPYLRDTDEVILLLKQIGLCFAASLCALSACFRWHIRENK